MVCRPQGTRLSSAQRAVVRRCRPLPYLADPLERELVVSGAVADLRPDDEFWAGVIEHAVSVPNRRNHALLRVLAALLTGLPREWAAGAAAPAGPALAVGDAWVCDRSIDAGYLGLICAYRFAADAHAMVFLIDELEGGVVRNAFVTRDVDTARQRLARHGPLIPTAADAAHWLLAKSYDRLDRSSVTPGGDVRRTRLLARRRIALAFG